MSLIEAYEHLQPDELDAIRAGVQNAPVSRLRSPVSGELMVDVTFSVDNDLNVGAGEFNPRMTIEVDAANSFGWFSREELRDMPVNTDNRAPGRPGLVGLGQLDDSLTASDAVFNNLQPEDYDEQDESFDGMDSVFSQVVRRLRT